jgi:hypothetical protein
VKKSKASLKAKEIEFLDYIIQFEQIEKDSKKKMQSETAFTK